MKKVVILAVVGILSFAIGTAGIYLAMPSLSPDTVDSTRVRLDSLGLLPSHADDIVQAAPRPDSLRADSTDSTVTKPDLPSPQDIIQELQDSLIMSQSIIQNLSADTSSLTATIKRLITERDELKSKETEATELSKSLSKLEDKQLGNILADLDLSVIELLYAESSARERTRLLQSMPPDKAARFVRALVKGPAPATPVAAKDDADAEAEGGKKTDEANTTAN